MTGAVGREFGDALIAGMGDPAGCAQAGALVAASYWRWREAHTEIDAPVEVPWSIKPHSDPRIVVIGWYFALEGVAQNMPDTQASVVPGIVYKPEQWRCTCGLTWGEESWVSPATVCALWVDHAIEKHGMTARDAWSALERPSSWPLPNAA